MDRDRETERKRESGDLSIDGQVSRRRFLQLAGLAGATVAIGGGLGGLLAGCGGTAASSAASTTATSSGASTAALTPKPGGTITIIGTTGMSNRTNQGWPFEGMGTTGNNAAVLETLLGQDRQGNMYGLLAESYKVAPDRKSMTFSVRKGVKFHDGSDLTGAVVQWNLQQSLKGNARPWTSVELVDASTVKVNFAQWKNDIPLSFTPNGSPPLNIVSKAAFDAHGKEWMKVNPVGTGPFKLTSRTPDVSSEYVKNAQYWNKSANGTQLPYLDGMKIVYTADDTTALMLAKSGQGDTLFAPPGKVANDYAQIGYTIHSVMNTVNYLLPDSANANSIWANQKVREAAEYAIDRANIAKAMGYGYWGVPYQIPPKSTAAYDQAFALSRKYDPAKAKQLLTEAGYANGFKTSIILSPMISGGRDLAIAVQSYLAKVGIQATLQFPDFAKWLTTSGANGTWHDACVLTPLVSQEPTFVGGVQFMDSLWGKGWLRTPEVAQAMNTCLTAPTQDYKLARAVGEEMTKAAVAIPINENGSGVAYKPYLIPNFTTRGIGPEMNYAEWWLNKQ